MSTVTLISGRQVDAKSQEWLDELRERGEHLNTLRRLSHADRVIYLENVARKYGQEASRRLARAYFEEREAQS